MSSNTELPNFAEEVRAAVGKGRKLPPVNDWHPEREGEIDIRIARDGAWLYQGEPIKREALVQLFATILRRDGDDFFLVTPAEKLKIQVEDAPFIGRMLDVEGVGKDQKLHISTNAGDNFTVDAAHPLWVELDEKEEPSPYVRVRDRLDALLNRQVYYELVELAVPSEDDPEKMGVWSSGQFYPLH